MVRMIATDIRPSREILAENLSSILKDRGRGSAKRLADDIGWPEQRISNLKHGRSGNPDTATLDAIAEGLGISVAELLTEKL
ncbi:MAG: helix-turn-helix domain-containing protein [Planctomycetota bacterium]|jgi:transcriptional regulator with XRE-family HTH domain